MYRRRSCRRLICCGADDLVVGGQNGFEFANASPSEAVCKNEGKAFVRSGVYKE
jgi:hypothetical protein